MSAPLADRSRDRRHRHRHRHGDYEDDSEDETYHRPHAPHGRDSRHSELPASGLSQRRQKYDHVSDEDDYRPREKRSSRRSPRSMAQEEPEIPPPIGDDRASVKGRKGGSIGTDLPPGAVHAPGTETDVNDGYRNGSRRHHRKKKGHSLRDEDEDEDNTEILDSTKSSVRKDGYGEQHRPLRRAHDYDYGEPPYRLDGHSGDRYSSLESRRGKRDHSYNEASLPRRTTSRSVDDTRRRRHAALPPGDDSDEYEKPRRRERHKPSRHDDGYGTDRPRRQARDDYYDRGYRTDGRESKRDKHREEDRRRSGRRRDDHADHDRKHRSDRRTARRHPDGMDFNAIMEKGKKNWTKVEPVAKPLLAQLAQTYLNNGRPIA